jgi:hypothetical protein
MAVSTSAIRTPLGAIRREVSVAPYLVDACRDLVHALDRLGRHADVIDAWCKLGDALAHHERLDEAVVAYREALDRKIDCLPARLGLGDVYFRLLQPLQTIEHLEAALAIEPAHEKAHQRLGWAYALAGNLERNYAEIAWYDRYGPWKRFEQPHWDGGPLDGKTILLWINAGLGDMIQHIRFASDVKARGARVIVECHRALVPVLARMPCVDEAVPAKTALPHFDIHSLVANLPRVLGIGWRTIPASVPYLSVDARCVRTWKRRLARTPGRSRRTVGVVWTCGAEASDVRVRSASLAAFAPLGDVSGVRFVSLLPGPVAQEGQETQHALTIEAPLDEACSIADTAALILNLDLVITVDTMAAHLAGALARPVWVLVPYVTDWRWGLDAESTAWYPTMRLFRQTRVNDWTGVIAHVRDALETWTGGETLAGAMVT